MQRHAGIGYELAQNLDVPVLQTAEQLVEVPTIVSYSSLQQTAKQTVDIPVPHGRGDRGGGGGFLSSRPEQHSTVLGGAVHVDIPVPYGRGGRVGQGGLQGFSQGQGSTAFSEAGLVDIPVPRRGGLHGPASASSSSHSPGAVDELFTGVLRTFPKVKKVRGWVRTRGRNWVRTLIHGLWLLVATSWRSRRTSWRQGRSPGLRWRRTQ